MLIHRITHYRAVLLFLAAAVFLAAPAALHAQGRAPTDADADLHRAYFLEHQSKEFTAAQALYRGVLAKNISDEAKRVAQRGADRCRDALAAQNFSRLMPADSLAYIEFNRPGRFIEQFAGLIGLTTQDMREVLDRRPSQESRQVAYMPGRIAISPALFEALTAFGGAAAALTDFDPAQERAPAGVLVLHHGDATTLKGLLETAFQFAPLGEKIRDLPTFGTEIPGVGRVTGVLTESLLIFGTGTELVTGVVERLIGERADSLADRADLADIASQRDGATIFAYGDLHGIIRRVSENASEGDRRDFKILDGLVDLDSLRWAALSLGIKDDTLGLRFSLRLADDHRSIAYNLMRLPPMTGQCLKMVPADAAAVFGMGLNPALTMAAADAAQGRRPDTAVSGLDLFREFFGNVREICGFVIAGDAGPMGLPNACILMAVNDIARSRALWDQFLSIPGIVSGEEPVQPRGVKIGETPAMSYAIPDFGTVYLAEIDGCIAICVTRNALKAAIRARGGKSVSEDAQLGRVIAALPRDTTIFSAAHVGRCIRIGAGKADNPAAGVPVAMAADLCSNTVAWFGLGQAPNETTIQIAISGLPDVNDAIEKFGPMINAFLPASPGAKRSSEPLVRKEMKVRGPREAVSPTDERQ